jgi:hypothetical protein
LTGSCVRHSIDHHHALVAETYPAIHSPGVFLLLSPTEGPPARCHKDRGHCLAFIGNKLFAVHLYFEGLPSLDPFFNSSIHHLHLILVPSTLSDPYSVGASSARDPHLVFAGQASQACLPPSKGRPTLHPVYANANKITMPRQVSPAYAANSKQQRRGYPAF